MGVNGAHGSNVGVVALEHQAHDQAQAHGQDGADAEIDVLFLVQIVQQCKKYGGQCQRAKIQNFSRHKTLPFLYSR